MKAIGIILLSVAVSVAVFAVLTFLWLLCAPQYTAVAYLGVNPPGETDLRRGVLTGEIMDRHKMSLARMAQTDLVFQKTIEKSEVKQTEWWRENVAHPIPSLDRATRVTPIRETNLIELSMTGANRKELPEIVNAWAGAFVEDTTDNANKDRRATIVRLQRQQDDLRTEMDRLDRDIKTLQFSDEGVIRHKISLLTNELQTLTGKLTELRLFHDRETRASKNFEEHEQAGLLDILPEMVEALDRDPALRRLHEKLFDLTFEMAVRGAGRQDDSAGRVAALRKLISEREKTVRESQISLLKDSYDRRIWMLTAQIQALTENRDNIEAQVTGVQGNLRNVIEWQAEKARRQAYFEVLEGRLMELRLSTRGAQPVYVRRTATEPKRPSMPRWGTMIPIGAALGLIVGLALALWRRIRASASRAEVTRQGHPDIGV
ncbi:MAG TPA: hypothetical protein VNA25_12150 [Phycisphaerae bacterium]|nr:hypothetical protein [Phycisphaerae bacterium]